MTIEQLHTLFLTANGVFTDTRKIKKNAIFFALKGGNFNGNSFADQAIKEGAAYAIIDEKEFNTSEQHILVHNVLETLQLLASYHRDYLDIPILALTGSNGKTTTKELINSVLSKQFKTTATIGNLNNHIGVPLTLLSMTKETEIGIVEMGANHLHEIEFLCTIAKPNYGYITNIGKAHLEGFGSLEGVLKGKTELYKYLQKDNKLIFLNAADNKLAEAASGMKTFTFSEDTNSNVQVKFSSANPMVIANFEGVQVRSNLIGVYNFSNISAAIAIGTYFKVDPKAIKQAIVSYAPDNNRSQIITRNNTHIILDAYNANPTSMMAAIDNFKQLDKDSKTVFLGDMFELGNEAETEHQKIADLAINTDFNAIYLLGSNFFKTKIDDSRVIKYESFEEFKKHWDSKKVGDSVLIKGSRGMKLERILDLI